MQFDPVDPAGGILQSKIIADTLAPNHLISQPTRTMRTLPMEFSNRN